VDSPPTVVIVGGGPAGTYAAIAARAQNPAARVILLSDEHCEPYEKPPLSKGVLTGKVQAVDAPIAGPGGVAAHGATLQLRTRCLAIDRAARTLTLEDGRRLEYGTLVLATGSLVRELPPLPLGTPHVHYLRSEADARQLKAKLSNGTRLLVVGGGLIGLEVAASAVELGVRTTVLELAPRILARVCDETIGAIVEAAHRGHGVDLRVGCGIASVTPHADGVDVVTTTGERLTADAIVVGTGARPNDALAAAAGLTVDDGIVVDEMCRTSDRAIFAGGDVVRFPGPHGPVRLENWRHALDQGTVAGRNAAGGGESYRTTPSFWSEQYDLYIQGVGWIIPGSGSIGRQLPGNAALTFDVRDGRIAGALGINVQRDMAAIRRLIERQIAIDPVQLADPAQPLAAMLKR
jgi:NADPH-dependent 2,4-dienoyl-CoA reductase/sulfur reductase-like enzyme